MSSGGGVFGALIFVIGILVAFAVMFGFFLVVPFFIFLAGIVVMLVSDRKRGRGDDGPEKAPRSDPAEGGTESAEARKAGI